MAKSKVAEPRDARQQIPLRRIRLTWTPPAIDNDEPAPVTINGERLAWLLRSEAAREPSSLSTPTDELELLAMRLRGLAELLGALNRGLRTGFDDTAIFEFLQMATDGMVRDLQHARPEGLEEILESAIITIGGEAKAAVA